MTGPAAPRIGVLQLIPRLEDAVWGFLSRLATGYGRTPDVVILEADGYEELCPALARELVEHDCALLFGTLTPAAAYTRPGASTTGGNPVAAATAMAVLEYQEKEDLPGRATALGGPFQARLEEIAERVRGVAEVRGRGLMLGMELVDGEDAPDAERTDLVLEGLKDRGFPAGKTGPGRNVLTFMPPLVLTSEDIVALGDALEELLG